MASDSSNDFFPAVCPNCNGELRVPSALSEVVCSYCGTKFAPRARSATPDGGQNQIENWAKLAQAAEEAQDLNRAAEYWSRILEVDSENVEAWIERGICLAVATRANQEHLREAMVCFDRAADLQPEGIATEYVSANLLIGTANYLYSALDALNDSLTDYVRRNTHRSQAVVVKGGVAENLGAGIGSANGNAWSENSTWKSHRQVISRQFLEEYAPLISESAGYAWRLHRSKDIAERVAKILSTVADAPILTEEGKHAFAASLSEPLNQARDAYPELTIASIEPDPKDTFDRAGGCLKTSAWGVVIIIALIVLLLCVAINS